MKQYFAKLDENNIVLDVVHKLDELTTTEIIELLRNEYNHPYWIGIDPNNVFRKNFPSKYWKFDSSKNAFIPPRPYPSWNFDDVQLEWIAPTTKPEENGEQKYYWDDEKYYQTGDGWTLVEPS